MSEYKIGKVSGHHHIFGDHGTINSDVTARIENLIEQIDSSDLPAAVREDLRRDADDLHEEIRVGRRGGRIQVLLGRIANGSKDVAAITSAAAQVEQAIRHLS
jgi:hypothetical protein